MRDNRCDIIVGVCMVAILVGAIVLSVITINAIASSDIPTWLKWVLLTR